jgi:carbon-monoxide dehydrogenase large subunit
MGVFGSRVSIMTGSATYLAATILRNQLLAFASARVGLDVQELSIEGPHVVAMGENILTVRELLSSIESDSPLVAEGSFASDGMAFPYGVHAAEVLVDS